MKLKQFRNDHDLSQNDLALLFGVTQGHISSIENNIRVITAAQLRILIQQYGFEEIQSYLEEDDKVPASITVNAPKISNNTAPVNAGEGTQTISTDAQLIGLLKQQSDQVSKAQEQMDRLITLLESKYNK